MQSRLTSRMVIGAYTRTHRVRKLHFGAGANVLPGWLNTDIVPTSPFVVYLDALKPLPFANASLDYVYSEHVIEHFSFAEGLRVLTECFRVLKPGGTLRLATPDLGFLIDLYGERKTSLQRDYIRWAIDEWVPEATSDRDAFVINNFMRSWGHQFIYDYPVLAEALVGVGFRDCRRCEVRESDDPHLRDLEGHDMSIPVAFNQLETFVIEAARPK